MKLYYPTEYKKFLLELYKTRSENKFELEAPEVELKIDNDSVKDLFSRLHTEKKIIKLSDLDETNDALRRSGFNQGGYVGFAKGGILDLGGNEMDYRARG